MMQPLVVYYSSPTENTHRFVEALGLHSCRIPISMKAECPSIDVPFVLVSPCYADNDGSKAVPKQVIRFLNDANNRDKLQGVIGAGNRNFGETFARAGDIISKKCGVPCLYKFELSGTPDDVNNVRTGIEKLWHSLTTTQKQKQIRQQTGQQQTGQKKVGQKKVGT